MSHCSTGEKACQLDVSKQTDLLVDLGENANGHAGHSASISDTNGDCQSVKQQLEKAKEHLLLSLSKHTAETLCFEDPHAFPSDAGQCLLTPADPRTELLRSELVLKDNEQLCQLVLAKDQELCRALAYSEGLLAIASQLSGMRKLPSHDEDSLKASAHLTVTKNENVTDAKDVAPASEQQSTAQLHVQISELQSKLQEAEELLQSRADYIAGLEEMVASDEAGHAAEVRDLRKAIEDKEGMHAAVVRLKKDQIAALKNSKRHLKQRLNVVSQQSTDDLQLLKDLIAQNPRLITVFNVEDILKLAERHPTDCDGIKRACEERLQHFENLLTIAQKCRLAATYNMDFGFIEKILSERPELITADNVEEILMHIHSVVNYGVVKQLCEQRLRQFRELPVSRRHWIATKYRLDSLSRDLLPQLLSQQAGEIPFGFGLPRQFFAPEHDVDLRQGSDQVFLRGGHPYILPVGSKRFALQVIGKYADDEWLANHTGREWAVAYHGTTLENVAGIVRNGFDLSKGRRFALGTGIYSTPAPDFALQGYSVPYDYKGRQYRLIIQVRVDPAKLSLYHTQHGTIYKVPDGSAIRPYAICVYAV